MLEAANRARSEPDEKLKRLFEYIDQHMLVDPVAGRSGKKTWTTHRIIVFTEYDDTIAYIRRHLDAHLQASDQADARVVLYRGATSLDERQEIKEAFNTDPTDHPVRILLATDAAREGLNLQMFCSNLFHFDIPWNPARLEQRNGRIDRKLQKAPVVYCRYFLYTNREEDQILRRIVEKTETIYRELGGFGTVLDKDLIQALRRRGIERARVTETVKMFDFQDPEDVDRAATALAEVAGDEEVEVDNEGGRSTKETLRERADRNRRARLNKSLNALRQIMEQSKAWLGFSDAQFRAALDCSLRLLEIEGGLRPEALERPRARRYYFPTHALERNPSWRETLNSLRSPRHRGEEFGAWYARCPIRPIVFEDPWEAPLGSLEREPDRESRVEPVHIHLEHRITQRLLSRFQSQGFIYHDLSRACLAHTEGSLPLVYLLGRLCLYGDHATRLHEDIIGVCAEWTDPKTRKAVLRPIDPKKLSEDEFMRRLDEALLAGDTGRIADVKRQELLTSAARDVSELQTHLERKAKSLESTLRAELAAAGEKEATNTWELLEGLKQRIDQTLDQRDRDEQQGRARAEERRVKAGPTLFDTTGDRVGLEEERVRREKAYEKKAMEKRKLEIEREILEEPDRIRRRYEVRTVRLEPVGIVYLWPAMG